MKHAIASPQRRQLMIAGLAGLALPAWWSTASASPASLSSASASPASSSSASASPASSSSSVAAAPASGSAGLPPGEPLLVSGRLVTPTGAPLQHAIIEFAHARGVRAVSDADGRFMARIATPRGGLLAYRVLRDGRSASHGRGKLGDGRAVRDETGVWRASFAATIA